MAVDVVTHGPVVAVALLFAAQTVASWRAGVGANIALKFENRLLPRFLQSNYSREQVFARGNQHLLAKGYSKSHDILSKSHKIDLVL